MGSLAVQSLRPLGCLMLFHPPRYKAAIFLANSVALAGSIIARPPTSKQPASSLRLAEVSAGISILRSSLHWRARNFRSRSHVGFADSKHFVGDVAHLSLYSLVGRALASSASI
jgi:hypothetical protein